MPQESKIAVNWVPLARQAFRITVPNGRGEDEPVQPSL